MSRHVLWCLIKNWQGLKKGYTAPCFVNRLGFCGKTQSLLKRVLSSNATEPYRVEECKKEHELSPVKIVSDESSTDIKPGGILHEQREIQYYHEIMENLKPYQDTILTRNKLLSLQCELKPDVYGYLEREDWSEAREEDLIKAFRLITSYAVQNKLPISLPQFNSITSAISSRLSEFSDDNLLEIGKLHTIWPWSESASAQNFKHLFKAFDNDCTSRYQTRWYASRDMVNILVACDILHWQRVGGFSHYLRMIVNHCSAKIKEPHHMIQLLSYLSIMKSVPATYKFYDLERRLYKFIEHYSLSELLVVVNAFFRQKSKLQFYPLMQVLLAKSLENITCINDYSLVTISKGLLYAPGQLHPQIQEFQRQILKRLDDFNIISSVHVLWMFAVNKILTDEFCDKMYEKVIQNVDELRSKEMSRLIIVFTENVPPKRDLKEFGEKVVEELKKQEKIDWLKKKVFIEGAALHRLGMCGVHPADFIDQYLGSVKTVRTGYEGLALDIHVEAFFPEYKGARLDPHIREDVYKYRFEDTNGVFVKSCGTVGKRSTFNLDAIKFVQNILSELVGCKEEFLLVRRLMPSFGYLDIVMCVNQDGTFLPIPQTMFDTKPWELINIPSEIADKGCKFIALTFISSEKQYAQKGISCFHREKQKLLEKLGFISLDISLCDWDHLKPSEIKADLKEKIGKALHTTV